jgi:sialidase-1
MTMKKLLIYISLAIFFFSGCKASAEKNEKPKYFVREGKAVNVINELNSWQKGKQGLFASGFNSFLHTGLCVGAGDFEIKAQLKLDDIKKDNASLMIDKTETVDPTEFIFSRNGNLVVRGFFFGNRTQTVRPLNGLIRSDEWFDLTIRRTDDMVTFFISGEPVWRMRYENDRPLGTLTLRPGETLMTVQEFWIIGETIPLDNWTPLLDRDYPVNGDMTRDVFIRGDDGYHTYRIPTIVKTNSGSLLAFAEGRKNSHHDHGDVDLVLRRSHDGGFTWEPLQLVYEEGNTAFITIGNPVPLVDQTNGRVWLFFCRNNRNVLVTYSDDDGATWNTPRDLTPELKKETWGEWYATGPCHGIQMESGRLIVPANHGLLHEKGSKPHIIFSDNHGVTWNIGGIPDAIANENSIADLGNNQLYINMRMSDHTNQKPYCRLEAWSEDGGDTFGEASLAGDLTTSICQASVLNFKTENDTDILLFSNPASWRRERMTIKSSTDKGKTWNNGILIYEGSSAYSDLVQIDDKTVGLLFERDTYGKITFVRFNPGNVLGD